MVQQDPEIDKPFLQCLHTRRRDDKRMSSVMEKASKCFCLVQVLLFTVSLYSERKKGIAFLPVSLVQVLLFWEKIICLLLSEHGECYKH